MVEGYAAKEDSEWRRTRQLITMIYNCNVTKKQHIKTPEQIMPLYSDKINQVIITPEEKERRLIFIREVLRKYYLTQHGTSSGTVS